MSRSYGRSSKGRWKRIRYAVGTVGVLVIMIFLFAVSVQWFRGQSSEPPEGPDTIEHILTPDPISQYVIEGGIDTQSPEAQLRLNSGGGNVGVARRGTDILREKEQEEDGTEIFSREGDDANSDDETVDKAFQIGIAATLPELNRETHYYKAWIVRPLPYDFIELGEMVTNEAGAFIIEWSSEGLGDTYNEVELRQFEQVVITRQYYDGPTTPQVKIAEGTFGE